MQIDWLTLVVALLILFLKFWLDSRRLDKALEDVLRHVMEKGIKPDEIIFKAKKDTSWIIGEKAKKILVEKAKQESQSAPKEKK